MNSINKLFFLQIDFSGFYHTPQCRRNRRLRLVRCYFDRYYSTVGVELYGTVSGPHLGRLETSSVYTEYEGVLDCETGLLLDFFIFSVNMIISCFS